MPDRSGFVLRDVIRAFLLAAAAMFSFATAAQPARSLETVEIDPPQPTADPERIAVTAFFSYQCPHCNAFEPALRRWVDRLPEDVLFERVPVSIGRAPWLPVARAFFALEAMDEIETLDIALFRAIHIEGEELYDKASIVEWVRAQGIDADRFSAMYGSFGIAASVRRAEQRAIAHRVISIPALAIDGRHLVPIVDDGTFEQQLAGVSELIERVRTAKGL